MENLTLGAVNASLVNCRKAGKIYRAINHNLRIELLKFIDATMNKTTVTELWVAMKMEQSVVSQHLRILRDANLVTTRRDGKFIYYSVNHAMIAAIDLNAKSLLFEAALKNQVSR